MNTVIWIPIYLLIIKTFLNIQCWPSRPHVGGFTDLMERVVSVFLFSRGADRRPSPFSLCEVTEWQHEFQEQQKHIEMIWAGIKLRAVSMWSSSSDLSLRCRRTCTRHSAGSPPTSGPLSLTRVECSPSPESSDWNIWNCSWCQTWGRPVKQRRGLLFRYITWHVTCQTLLSKATCIHSVLWGEVSQGHNDMLTAVGLKLAIPRFKVQRT